MGMFIDSEMEELVKFASDGVEVLADHADHLSTIYRQIIRPETADLKFGTEEVADILRVANEHADDAENGMIGLHAMIVTIHNVIAAIVDSRSVKRRTGIPKDH